ncbi:tyrosine recombinase XerC [Amycolatopsis sp. WQ 127309]|uniref:site-specific integrase n=1 Tax=Amycolatopsis sp. WQ 127309 TaxID=2932773 RepID=UPI001FF55331|nr:tyrosine-type recombinase/integrase [Amycolatopsis sp. WQ 127309]UOZ06890.1 tyrosine-type recombinase/integrase [Amycolatopsis sp. WQ 127309]
MANGSVFRRCSCRDENKKSLGSACQKLKNKRHGQWFLRIELPPDAEGNRRPRRRGGYESATEAEKGLQRVRDLLGIAEEGDTETLGRIGDLLAGLISQKQPLPEIDAVRRLVRAGAQVLEHPMMEAVFDKFLALKKRTVSRNMYRSYESQIRLYLRPHLAKVRVDRLRVGHLDEMFEAIVERNDLIGQYRASGDPEKVAAVKWQRPVGPASLHRIKETLRAILRPYVDQGLLTHNVAKLVQLPPAVRPTPKLWTPERVALWRRTGTVPYPVMVWDGEQTGQFLDFAINHPLYPLFHLIAHTGLRRGEACGQRRSDTFLDAGSIEVANQIVQYGWETGQGKPKTPSSEGIVPIDPNTVLILRVHLALQDAARAKFGDGWPDHDLLFTKPDGSPLHPADVADEFARLITLAGLPPITLHGLRHGAATLALAAGVDIKVIQHAPALVDQGHDGPLHQRRERSPGRRRPEARRSHPAAAAFTPWHSRAPLGLARDHCGQSRSGRRSSGNHKSPG